MTKVKFIDIIVGQVYVTRGGTAVINKSGKTISWGYDRVLVIKKNDTKLTIILSPYKILEKVFPPAAKHLTQTVIDLRNLYFDCVIS